MSHTMSLMQSFQFCNINVKISLSMSLILEIQTIVQFVEPADICDVLKLV